MKRWISKIAGGLALAGAALLPAQAQAPAAAASAPQAAATAYSPPPGFVAPAEPKPGETNAERAKSQPGNNAPNWRAVRETGTQPGFTSLPGPEMGVLIQPFAKYPGSANTTAGEAWRQVRNNWIIPYGGSLLLLGVVALGLFYWKVGTIGGHEPDTGRKIERFTYFERVAHWTVALTFVILGVSGIVLAFGKFFLLPVLGATLFGWLSYALKNLHNFVGPLFAVSLVVFFVTYVRDNIPKGYDFTWLAKGGGILSGKEVPSHKFNAGEKIVFWGGVTFLGLIVVASGLVLDKLVPGLAYLRGDMQIAHLVHAVASVLMMAMFTVHIYMGTIGMDGALNAMKTGIVDEGWAKEHHELWHDDVKAGKIPAVRSAQPGPGLGQASAQA